MKKLIIILAFVGCTAEEPVDPCIAERAQALREHQVSVESGKWSRDLYACGDNPKCHTEVQNLINAEHTEILLMCD